MLPADDPTIAPTAPSSAMMTTVSVKFVVIGAKFVVAVRVRSHGDRAFEAAGAETVTPRPTSELRQGVGRSRKRRCRPRLQQQSHRGARLRAAEESPRPRGHCSMTQAGLVRGQREQGCCCLLDVTNCTSVSSNVLPASKRT